MAMKCIYIVKTGLEGWNKNEKFESLRIYNISSR